jgi:hypothetical protein
MFKKIAILICAVLMFAGIAAASEQGYNLPQAQAGINFLGTGVTIGAIEYGTYDYYHYGYGYYDYYYGYNTTTENSTSFFWGGLHADVLAIQAIGQIQSYLPCGVDKMSQSFENNLLLKSNGLTIKMNQEGYQKMSRSNYGYDYAR